MKPYFIADSATVTVMRPLASSSFGKYSLTLPDGVGLEDVYTLSAPNNELAYVAQLTSSRRVGGLARRFMRADVNVTATGGNDDTWTPDSDVDVTLTESASRVGSDFFLESDISRAGLGSWREFVDFNVGDVARVEIWGRVVELPITRIEPSVSDFSDNDVKIHVGGQLMNDEQARLVANSEVTKAVLADRRNLMGIRATAKAATTTAASAQAATVKLREVLSGAGATEEDVRTQLADLNTQIQAHGEATDALPLIPAYIAANTARWKAQEKIDALQDQQVLLTQRLAEANQRAIALLALQNHGALFIQSSYVLPAGPWVLLNFSGVRGELKGCQTTTVSSSNGSGGGLKFLSPGDWNVRLRVNLPPGDAFTGTNTGIRITLMPKDGGKFLDRATSFSNNDGYDQTLMVDLTATIPESGCYVYAEAYASTASGNSSWWPADTGPELTELSARQLSYPDLV